MDPISIRNAKVEFVGEREDYEGSVSVLEGWVYVPTTGEYIPREKVAGVIDTERK